MMKQEPRSTRRELMLKVWLYAYALGVTSARRLEQRIRRRLGVSLSGGRGRTGQLGVERVSAAAQPGDQRCVHAGVGGDDSPGARGHRFDAGARSGVARTDGQRNQAAPGAGCDCDGRYEDGRKPATRKTSRNCRGKPERVSADTGFFSLENLYGLRERGIDGYVPDANLSYELKGKGRARGIGRSRRLLDSEHRRMRLKLRSAPGRPIYGLHKTIVEPVFGVLKQQRGM